MLSLTIFALNSLIFHYRLIEPDLFSTSLGKSDTMMNEVKRIILASTSPYRRILLERLHIPFEVYKPAFEEAESGSMPPEKLVRHNTLGKATATANKFPDATVIASDQIAVCGDTILGKPGGHDASGCTSDSWMWMTSKPMSVPNNPMIAPVVSNPKAWASACLSVWKVMIPPP